VIEATLAATWKAARVSGQGAATQRAVESATLEHLLALAANKEPSAEARAIARKKATSLRLWLEHAPDAGATEQSVREAAIARITLFEREPDKYTPAPSAEAPPGMPIGDDEDEAALLW
jgi:hypothetical protein